VAVADRTLLAVVELKSQVGSFGNNFNNRTEEAIGNATDLWTAYREGAFKSSPRPWLGYFMMLEDAAGSTRPVGVREMHFKAFKEFRGTSYSDRYALLCKRLVLERLYDAACLILSSRETGPNGDYREPDAQLSFKLFAPRSWPMRSPSPSFEVKGWALIPEISPSHTWTTGHDRRRKERRSGNGRRHEFPARCSRLDFCRYSCRKGGRASLGSPCGRDA
jgi:hypothetical protein